MSHRTLGYWGIRGYAEPIRMFLAHLGVEFEDKQYQQGAAPEFDRSDWTNVKDTLGLAFPNLPYWIDGDVKISETFAIFYYIAATYAPSYLGNTIEDKAHHEMFVGIIKDIKGHLSRACYSPDAIAQIPGVIEAERSLLTRIGNWLSGKSFLLGDHPSWIDFYFYEILDQIEAMSPGFLATVSGNFETYKGNVRALANVEAFVTRTPRLKFNGISAGWS